MSFEIRIKDRPLKFISQLQKRDREILQENILLLKTDPVPVKSLDVTKMKGYKNIYRIRKGKIRILYEVFWKEKIIRIHRIDFRGKVYK
jgi:mRNA interferase RelE/StbE